jgi:hypothetical protein
MIKMPMSERDKRILYGNAGQTVRNMENYLRNENDVTNLRIALDSRIDSSRASWQISNNNAWTETVIQENKRVLLK